MFLCAGHQCLRDRMFGIALDGCGHAKHLVIGESIGGSGLYDAMRTESERTCLVEHHRVQETSFFEAASIAYKQAVTSATRGRDGGHQDRKSGEKGKRVAVRVDHGGCRRINKKKNNNSKKKK